MVEPLGVIVTLLSDDVRFREPVSELSELTPAVRVEHVPSLLRNPEQEPEAQYATKSAKVGTAHAEPVDFAIPAEG